MATNSHFDCHCAVTVIEIAAQATRLAGHKISPGVVRRARARLAQAHLDAAFAAADDGAGGWEKGCIRNPYLPIKQVGGAHVFRAAAARKILNAAVAAASKSHHDRATRRYKRARRAARV